MAAGSSSLGTREHVLPELTQSFSQSAGVTYDGKLLISACALLHEKEIIAGGIYGWFQRISHNFYRNWNQYQDIRWDLDIYIYIYT